MVSHSYRSQNGTRVPNLDKVPSQSPFTKSLHKVPSQSNNVSVFVPSRLRRSPGGAGVGPGW
jgi:hypothetical protein